MRDETFLFVIAAAILGFTIGYMAATPTHNCLPPVQYNAPIQDVLPSMGQR
jgi:hypothetical protein